MCAGRESKSFSVILRNLILWCSEGDLKRILSENLYDELGAGDPEEAHYLHYLKLLDGLDIARDTFFSYREGAGIKLALSLAYNISFSKNESCALGYLLINEAITPITYGAARDAIMSYYPQLKTDFFDLHIKVDEVHVRNLYQAVRSLPPNSYNELLFGIDTGERGMAVLLDEAFGVFDYFSESPSVDWSESGEM